MNYPLYIIERWPLGWLICTSAGQSGIPMNALTECLPLFPDGVLDSGIVHHINAAYNKRAVFCIALPNDIKNGVRK